MICSHVPPPPHQQCDFHNRCCPALYILHSDITSIFLLSFINKQICIQLLIATVLHYPDQSEAPSELSNRVLLTSVHLAVVLR